MKKVAKSDVITKFAEVIELCPPEHAALISAAMAAFLEEDSTSAEHMVDTVVAKTRKNVKRKKVKAPPNIDNDLLVQNIDTNFREFK